MRILVSEELRDVGIPQMTVLVNAIEPARYARATNGRVEPAQAVLPC